MDGQHNTDHVEHASQPKSFLQKILKRFSYSRKTFAPVIILTLLVGVYFTIQQVQRQQNLRKSAYPGGAVLYLSSSVPAVREGAEFDVNVLIDANNLNISGSLLSISYDPALQVMGFTNGEFLDQEVRAFSNDSANHVASVSLGATTNQEKTGTGLLGTFRFKALQTQASPVSISFSSETIITALTKPNINVLDVANPLSISIRSSNTPPGAILSLISSKTPNVAPGETFTIEAQIDTKDLQVTGTELHFMYPSNLFDLKTVTPGTFLPVPIRREDTFGAGHAVISVGSTAEEPKTGIGTVATFTMMAKQTETQPVQFSLGPDTKVAVLTQADTNMLGSTNPVSVGISASQTPTNTPTPSISPSVTPTPSQLFFVANLLGSNEDPPNNSPASGRATVLLTDDGNPAGSTIKVSLNFTGLTDTQTSAHIHGLGPQGTTAPIIITFQSPLGPFVDRTYTLAPDEVQGLKDGLLYVNVHTRAFSGGEIRGQLLLSDENPNVTPTPTPTSQPQPSNTPVPSPTPTPTPPNTTLNFSIRIPSIGTNPVVENINPLHGSRIVRVEIFLNSTLAKSTSGILNFTTPQARFTGSVDLGNTLTSGIYDVKFKLDNSLKKKVSGITINALSSNTIPQDISVITGDANNDNLLDVFDYNIILSCYEDRASTAVCGGDETVSDLDDDGTIDIVDLNILLYHFKQQIDGD